MKEKMPPLMRLRRTARHGIVWAWLIAIAFLVLAAVSLNLRRISHRYWQPGQIEPLKHDCRAALATSPDVAERFERFCCHFDIATETAQDFMLFLALFCVLVSGLAIWQATFSRMVLRHLKQDEIHNESVEDAGAGHTEPSC